MQLRERVSLAGFFLPYNPPKVIMESYWDLYVAYVNECVQENRKNGIDPVHYEMEWNHWLPQCLFGDQPVGQWLTLRQHAIASALQTIAFEYRCMFGTHVEYLPDWLWGLAKPYYDAGSLRGAQITLERKLGIFDPKNKEAVEAVNIKNWTTDQRSEYAKIAHERKGQQVRSALASNAAKKSWENMNDEEREARKVKSTNQIQKVNSSRTSEQRRIAGLKAWETRRRNQST